MRAANLAAVALAAALPSACGAETPSTGAATPRTVTVFAAASLTRAFEALGRPFHQANPAYRVRFDFAGSPTLVTQLTQGARADALATADSVNMAAAVTAGVAGTPHIFARNVLEIAVATGNPNHLTGLADLGRAGLTVVLAAPNVPAGRYAEQALAKAGVRVHPSSLETDVEGVLTAVETGQADAGIVYATDVAGAAGKVAGVRIPAADNVVATYPVAQVKGAPDAAGASAFIAYLLSAARQEVLQRFGFEGS